MEELMSTPISSPMEYYDLHIAVDWTLDKNSDLLYGLLKWSEFRRDHSDLYNLARFKSSSSSTTPMEKANNISLPSIQRLSIAFKDIYPLVDRAERAIYLIIVNLLTWDSQWVRLSEIHNSSLISRMLILMCTLKIENHEEVDMIAEKLYQKIPPKRELEFESASTADASNAEEQMLNVESTKNELNLSQVDSRKPKQEKKSSQVKRAASTANRDTTTLSEKTNRRSRLSLPSCLIKTRSRTEKEHAESIIDTNKSDIEE